MVFCNAGFQAFRCPPNACWLAGRLALGRQTVIALAILGIGIVIPCCRGANRSTSNRSRIPR